MMPGTLTLSLSCSSLSTRQHWLVWLELSPHARYISKCLQLPICFSTHIMLVTRIYFYTHFTDEEVGRGYLAHSGYTTVGSLCLPRTSFSMLRSTVQITFFYGPQLSLLLPCGSGDVGRPWLRAVGSSG